jgi:predicted dehydrogenase
MLNIGIVGCGYWGPNLIRNFNSLSDCTVKWLCDANPDRLTYVKKLYNQVKTTTSFENMVNNDDIDAVAIATPVRFHFEMAKAALLAGKHTFIEKPMGMYGIDSSCTEAVVNIDGRAYLCLLCLCQKDQGNY